MSLIDWTRYVDKIYCLHFLPYLNRLDSIKENLDYMDILSSPIFSWYFSYPNAFDKLICNYIKPPYCDYYNERKAKVTNLNIAYHNIFREVQELEYKKILIIEDDCTFVCGRKKLFIEALEHLPENWDYIQFDKKEAFNGYLNSLVHGDWFHSNYTGGYWGTVFAMWSLKGINIAVKELESKLTMADILLANRNDEKLNTLNRYVSKYYFMYSPENIAMYKKFS